MLPLHHGPVKRTTRIERVSPEWRPGALPSELRPRSDTPGWSRTSGLCRRRTALSPLSYGRTKEPPAGIEPAPRPYKGRVLAVDTTEAKWRRRESNPLLLGANEALYRQSFIPKQVRTLLERRLAAARAISLSDVARPALGCVLRLGRQRPGAGRPSRRTNHPGGRGALVGPRGPARATLGTARLSNG